MRCDRWGGEAEPCELRREEFGPRNQWKKPKKEEGTEEPKRDSWDECGHEKYQANAGEASLVSSLRTLELLLSLLVLSFFFEMLTSFRAVPSTVSSVFSALSISHALVGSEWIAEWQEGHQRHLLGLIWSLWKDAFEHCPFHGEAPSTVWHCQTNPKVRSMYSAMLTIIGSGYPCFSMCDSHILTILKTPIGQRPQFSLWLVLPIPSKGTYLLYQYRIYLLTWLIMGVKTVALKTWYWRRVLDSGLTNSILAFSDSLCLFIIVCE